MTTDDKRNLITYGIFLLITIVCIYYGAAIASVYTFVRIWRWESTLILLIGIPFLFWQTTARIPNFWQTNITNTNRLIIPLTLGITFGILDVLVFKVLLHPEPYHELPSFTQPFPYSIFLYFSGAFEVELFYRLIPITIILLVGQWYKQGQYYTIFFWVSAVLTAIREPLEQLPEGNVLVIIYSLLTGFLMNFLQAVWFRKAGFLATLSFRLGHYLIWHILLGLYIQFVELPKFH